MIPCYIQKKTKTLIKNKGPYIIMIQNAANKKRLQDVLKRRGTNYSQIKIIQKASKNSAGQYKIIK